MKTDELLEDLNFILQERGFDPGTIRTWGEYDYEKQKSGDWKKIGKTKHGKLKKKIDDKLPHPPSFEQHIKIAEEVIGKHQGSLQAKLDRLKEISSPGSIIQGRTKDLESAVGKVARKPENYRTAADLGDLTGTRIITNNLDQVMETVENIRGAYKILEEDDKIRKPQDGYRSYHLIAEDDQGLPFEIQVRTEHQHTWAEWSHDVYKPHTEEEERAIKLHKAALDDYRLKMSAFFYAEDNPREPKFQKPDCPQEVQVTPFGCM